MELDTGSALSLIPESQYHAQFSTTALSPTAITLRTYSGERISPLGVFRVNIKHEGQSHIGDAYVVSTTGRGPALFGRDWLQHIQLDWKAIQCHRLASPAISQPIPTQPDTDLGKLLQRYAVVFGEDRGHLKAHTIVYFITEVRKKQKTQLKNFGGQFDNMRVGFFTKIRNTLKS